MRVLGFHFPAPLKWIQNPHSPYLPPKSYKDMLVDTSGKFGGLGIEISIRKGVLTVVPFLALMSTPL